MIPEFEDDRDDHTGEQYNRVEFVKFIQRNKTILNKLLTNVANFTGVKKDDVIEGYKFIRDFNLGDDANRYSLMYESLSEFDDDDVTPTGDIVKEFKKWLKLDVIQEQLQDKLVGGGRNTKTKGKRTKAKTRTTKTKTRIIKTRTKRKEKM
uniref:Uncharacterized protein n=1 Tax=viral metagenome TaxID=1070528 RepID=A0A6C0I5A4_9ZZZZ